MGAKTNARTNTWGYICSIGFYAGLIWGAVKLAEFGLKFTQVSPGWLIEPFYKHAFLAAWPGMAMGWGAFIAFSVLASGLYGVALRRIKGPYAGIAYGIVWWALIYLLIGPWLQMIPPVTKLDWNTLSSDFCLFLLWGLFIGYSIAMEFTEEESREPQKKK